MAVQWTDVESFHSNINIILLTANLLLAFTHYTELTTTTIYKVH